MVSYSTIESAQQIRKLKGQYKENKIPWEDTLAAAYVEATSSKTATQNADASSLIYTVEQILKRELGASVANKIQAQANKPASKSWWDRIRQAFFKPRNEDNNS